jgi:hypothetical protein
MPAFCILGSLFLVVAAYVYVSFRERTFLNVLTPSVAFLVPADYLLEFYHLVLFGPSGSNFAYGLIYSCYAATFVAFAISYSVLRVPAMKLPFASPVGTGNGFIAYLTLAAAFALYAPVLVAFKSEILNPRLIYAQTRTGYGVYFFLSSTLCYVSVILLLFKKNLSKLHLSIFLLICLIFLWLHGSKNQMLLLIFIVSTYWVYVLNRRLSFGKFAGFALMLAPFGIGLFLLTNPLLVLGQQGLRGLASYSDYTRNGMLLIDSDFGPFYGKLTLEQEAYGRIPRVLMPSKPTDFGVLYLAEHFYPYEFIENEGAPAFSFGTMLADFGALALPLLVIENIVAGALLKMFVNGLRKYKDPGNFILVLFSAGLTIIPVSVNFVLFEALLVGVTANLLNSARLRPYTVPHSPG